MREKLFISTLVLTLFFVIVGGGENRESHEARLARMSKECGLPFPSGSLVVEFKDNRSVIDPIWVAKVTVPASKAEAFREAIHHKKDAEVHWSNGLYSRMSWWTPTPPLVEKNYHIGDSVLVKVILASGRELDVVYIERAVF